MMVVFGLFLWASGDVCAKEHMQTQPSALNCSGVQGYQYM